MGLIQRPGERRDEAASASAIEDVRIRRADLPEENTQAILTRMQSERERVASQARAEGAEAAARIRADAERDRTVLLAEARATADKLRGEGEAHGDRDLRRRLPARPAILRDLAHAAGLSRRVRRRQLPPGADPGQRFPEAAARAPTPATVGYRANRPQCAAWTPRRIAGRAIPLPLSRWPAIAHECPVIAQSMRLSRCHRANPPAVRATALAVSAVLAIPLAAGAACRGAGPPGAGQLRRPGRQAAARRGQHLLQPDRSRRKRRPAAARRCRRSRPARRSSSSSTTSWTATASGRGGDRNGAQPGRRPSAGACRASAPASSSTRPASS